MENQLTKKTNGLKEILKQDNIKQRFAEIMGAKAPAFISSIINVAADLKDVEPNSVIMSAAVAATLDLPIDKNLGFAHIVPYSGKAQFQMGYKGFIQLAMRTGQYRLINACEIYEGELVSEDRIRGTILFDSSKRISDKIVGYAAYFQLANGFEKTVYMSMTQVEQHGKKYSKSFENTSSRWKVDFDSMALKTVIKRLLSKWGILSIDLQKAITFDQSTPVNIETGQAEYADSTDVTHTEATPAPAKVAEYVPPAKNIQEKKEPEPEPEEQIKEDGSAADFNDVLKELRNCLTIKELKEKKLFYKALAEYEDFKIVCADKEKEFKK